VLGGPRRGSLGSEPVLVTRARFGVAHGVVLCARWGGRRKEERESRERKEREREAAKGDRQTDRAARRGYIKRMEKRQEEDNLVGLTV